MEKVVLMLESGDRIEVTYPVEISEELFDDMREAQSRDALWNVCNFLDVIAKYKGFPLNHINMKRVIGIQ